MIFRCRKERVIRHIAVLSCVDEFLKIYIENGEISEADLD